MKSKTLLTFFLFLILLSKLALSEGIGLGITNYHLEVSASVGESRVSYVGIINPSNYDLKAKIYFDCTNCKHDVKLFGYKIGEIVEDPYQIISIDKQEVYVPANTISGGVPVTITLTPKLILIKQFRFELPEALAFFIRLWDRNFTGKVSIPYPTLIIGGHRLEGTITADLFWSSFGALGVRPSVGSTAIFTYKGMPLSSFILLLVGVGILIYVITRKLKIIRKIKPGKKREKLLKEKKKIKRKRILKTRKSKKK